jgi:hypothetical protein
MKFSNEFGNVSIYIYTHVYLTAKFSSFSVYFSCSSSSPFSISSSSSSCTHEHSYDELKPRFVECQCAVFKIIKKRIAKIFLICLSSIFSVFHRMEKLVFFHRFLC